MTDGFSRVEIWETRALSRRMSKEKLSKIECNCSLELKGGMSLWLGIVGKEERVEHRSLGRKSGHVSYRAF